MVTHDPHAARHATQEKHLEKGVLLNGAAGGMIVLVQNISVSIRTLPSGNPVADHPAVQSSSPGVGVFQPTLGTAEQETYPTAASAIVRQYRTDTTFSGLRI